MCVYCVYLLCIYINTHTCMCLYVCINIIYVLYKYYILYIVCIIYIFKKKIIFVY